ncbi:MAG: GxxExxY protein [Parachlamydiaceae bacterium]
MRSIVNRFFLKRLKLEAQKLLPIFYQDVMLHCGDRLDWVLEDQVMIEI